jgi:LysR family transcriptional regulator, nod-box dependent transcriptional activator
LLEESSVSRAADRVFITQSAMSNALARLRRHFGDELVVQVGRRMVLTERGQQLRPEVRSILMRIQQVAQPMEAFEPATARKTFRIGASDYFTMVVLPKLLMHLSQFAPGIGIEVLPLTGRLFDDLERGDVDLLIVPQGYAQRKFPHQSLFTDEWVCVTWSGLEQPRTGMTLDRYLALEHVAKKDNNPNFPSVIELELGRQRLARKVTVRVPHYGLLPLMIVGTPRVATVQGRVAHMYADWQLPLSVYSLPFDCAQLEEAMQWHPTKEADQGHLWLREAVRSLCEQLQ